MALEVARATDQAPTRVVVDAADVAKYLGRAKFFSEVAERTEEPGVATGLAWTSVGGEILFVEATRMPGTGKLQLTGQRVNPRVRGVKHSISTNFTARLAPYWTFITNLNCFAIRTAAISTYCIAIIACFPHVCVVRTVALNAIPAQTYWLSEADIVASVVIAVTSV